MLESEFMTQQFERRFTNDFFREVMPDVHYQPRVWLGPLPPGKEAREYMVTGRWADAVVFEPGQITIIEFKLEPAPNAIGQLDLYEQMWKQTMRFKQYWDRPVQKVLVTTRVDDHVMELAKDHNIEYKVFRPDWIPFWEKRRFRV